MVDNILQSSDQLYYELRKTAFNENEFTVMTKSLQVFDEVGIELTAFVLGESHALQFRNLETGEYLTEIFSCKKPVGENDQASLENVLANESGFHYSFKRRIDVSNYSDDYWDLKYVFPDDSITGIKWWFDDWNTIIIETVHQYPREGLCVFTETSIGR